MSDRYWNADDPPDEILDWVSDNVVSAIKSCWEDRPPRVYLSLADSPCLSIVVEGPPIPNTNSEDEDEDEDACYLIKFDLVEQLKNYAQTSGFIHRPLEKALMSSIIEAANIIEAGVAEYLARRAAGK